MRTSLTYAYTLTSKHDLSLPTLDLSFAGLTASFAQIENLRTFSFRLNESLHTNTKTARIIEDPAACSRRSVCNSNPERLLLLYTPGGFMPNTQTLLVQAYSAFNHRDIDGALALMSE